MVLWNAGVYHFFSLSYKDINRDEGQIKTTLKLYISVRRVYICSNTWYAADSLLMILFFIFLFSN